MANTNPAPTPPGPVSGTDFPASRWDRVIELTRLWATSWWGWLAAYISGITAAVVAFQKLKKSLVGSPTWLPAFMVVAPLVLELVFHVIPTLVEQRRRKRLAEITGEMKAGYFSLAPREDEKSFTRADKKHQNILDWLQQPTAPVLYLTGLSGSGKSSLLEAWVLPHLRRKNTVVVRLRGYQDPLVQLDQELQRPGVIWRKPANESADIRLLLERACRHIQPRRLMIVLDQFEEFVILQNSAQQERLQQLFSSFAQAPIDGLTFLLVFRSDYIGPIEDLKLPPLRQHRNWEEVPPFTEHGAWTFMQGSELKIDETLARSVLREAAEIEQTQRFIRPITINLCGLVLSCSASGLPRGVRPGGLIRWFLRDSLMIPAIREVTPTLVPCLISNYVTKRPRTITELAEETSLKPAEVRGCLGVLGQSDRAIVHALDSEQQTWEISHDFLVPLLNSIVAPITGALWRKIRSWLPWVGLAILVLYLAIAFSLKQNPQDHLTVALQQLGWTVTSSNSRLELKADSIPKGDSLTILQHIPVPITLHLDEIDSRISQWGGLHNLTALDLANAKVTDIGLLKDLKSLTSLDLSHTKVRDIGLLKDLKSLTSLDLSSTKVKDIKPLSELDLTSLDLSSTHVIDVGPLKDLKNLTSLNLSSTPVSDMGPLKDFKSLRFLDLSSTHVSDVGPLKDLKNLATLKLSYTPVSDVGPLKGLKNLTTLELSYTKVSDVGPLKELKSLTYFSVPQKVSDAALKQLKETLPHVYIDPDLQTAISKQGNRHCDCDCAAIVAREKEKWEDSNPRPHCP